MYVCLYMPMAVVLPLLWQPAIWLRYAFLNVFNIQTAAAAIAAAAGAAARRLPTATAQRWCGGGTAAAAASAAAATDDIDVLGHVAAVVLLFIWRILRCCRCNSRRRRRRRRWQWKVFTHRTHNYAQQKKKKFTRQDMKNIHKATHAHTHAVSRHAHTHTLSHLCAMASWTIVR